MVARGRPGCSSSRSPTSLRWQRTEGDPLAEVAFPEPVFSDERLAQDFLRLHVALASTTTTLERDERLAGWPRGVIDERSATRRSVLAATPRDDRALRRALELLAGEPTRNVGLDELAAAAGIGKFRLVRLFRERTGLPPHALQIAHRVRIARRLLEAGEGIAATAYATGFADQSHLHRHSTAASG
jgi:AraC-like DNA-binding protein